MTSTTMYTQTDYKILPDEEQLSQINRTLTFHAVENSSPQVLTAEEIQFYNQNGYLKGFRIFEQAEANELRGYFDKLLERVLAAGGDSYSIISAHLKFGRVYDLVRHPKIVAYVTDILGPDVICWGAHFFCKLPHDPKQVAWHQDASFWPLTPSKTTTVWLAIDDADPDNACMRFVAGSHRHGHLTYRIAEEAEQSVLRQNVDEVEKFGSVVDDDLKAGEISLHSDLLLHGSAANHSARRRCGLTLRYCAAEVWSDPALGWNREGVIVSGSDSQGHWLNPGRPASD